MTKGALGWDQKKEREKNHTFWLGLWPKVKFGHNPHQPLISQSSLERKPKTNRA